MGHDWKLCRIGKQYNFSAAHRLTKVGDNHPCARFHGHNYMVEVEFRGEIAPMNGFAGALDFAVFDDAMRPLLAQLDHNYLNDIPGLENPTAEHIAAWIMERFTPYCLYSVTVWETPKCWAKVINADGYFHKAHRD